MTVALVGGQAAGGDTQVAQDRVELADGAAVPGRAQGPRPGAGGGPGGCGDGAGRCRGPLRLRQRRRRGFPLIQGDSSRVFTEVDNLPLGTHMLRPWFNSS
jgi:hypothetical protein